MEALLEDSHLIPNSIVKRFYRTSPTGGARSVGAPNRREQNFLHRPLLCRPCEERFALREDRWMKDVDQQMDRPKPWSFVCAEEHRYFAASLAWRSIVWELPEQEGENAFTHDDRRHIAEAERQLAAYLLDLAPYPEPPLAWPHLVTPPDGFLPAPPGLNVYLRGSLDATVNAFGESIYAVANLGGYLVASVITIDPEHLITWTLGTELRPGRTVHVNARRFPRDPGFGSLLTARAAAAAASHKALSPKQQANVKRRVDAVLGPELAMNPHIIATMADHLNKKG